MMKKPQKHVLSLSYGKDSMACLGAIEQLGWPLDEIYHVEIWATQDIPADLPPMLEFKKKADEFIKNKYGIEVKHITNTHMGKKVTYESVFYKMRQYSRNGHDLKIYGFPFQGRSWCADRLKTSILDSYNKNCVVYVGIAADEPERLKSLEQNKKISPLAEAGWDEQRCWDWCVENDVLSPIYKDAIRGGCWFCHNQGADQLRLLRKNYPEYWAILLKWDKDSPVTFKANGHTVHDYDIRFKMEDLGLIDENKKWFWKYIDEAKQNGLLEGP